MKRGLLFLFWSAVLAGPLAGLPAYAADQRAADGMIAWPHDEMVRALGIFIPQRMNALDVPGASVAIVADGKIVYSASFGTADRRKGTPVTSQTLFKAGELGETLAAYGALSLARDKLLFLDAPLSRDLPSRWLSRESDDRLVTLRQVLTHTSGLPDNVAHPSRRTSFEPGERFSHSGVGFLYLQHVMETIEKKPFDDVMKARVFGPLGMTSSTYEDRSRSGIEARGYVPLRFPVAVFYLPFMAAFLGVLGVVWAVMRFTMRPGRVETTDLLWPLVLALAFAIGLVWYGLGFANAAFMIGVAVVYALGLGALGGFIFYLIYVVGFVRSRQGVIARGRSRSPEMALAFAFLSAFVVSLAFLDWTLGVPRFALLDDTTPNAANSFRTNAEDMARFMIEIVDGQEIGQTMRNRMVSERVIVDPTFSWGLGIGIRKDQAGETLWTRGSSLGFESLMVIDPAQRTGVVVLTNSRSGSELAQQVVRNVLGRDGVWALP
ncbi:serine hydrolase [Parvibaculum sedimenti]|uniref:Serine hydrolase n=1 Tax=Parvibaculum sedimenti TaxID=2608632 RepID=A0A6N6VLG0_9HYPH|nr:serine hydrolase domain-containing protein [Parvibaculum sedimenti]KAB7742266.1 serine hydrolase [Parvibaculum sedimenti]